MHFHKGRNLSARYKSRFPACWFGLEYPKSTYNSAWQKQHRIFHPTIKNAECLAWLIQISSDPGALVFDGFMGTGSTALAALETGRRFLGAEIFPAYWQTAQQRLAAWHEEHINIGTQKEDE